MLACGIFYAIKGIGVRNIEKLSLPKLPTEINFLPREQVSQQRELRDASKNYVLVCQIRVY